MCPSVTGALSLALPPVDWIHTSESILAYIHFLHEGEAPGGVPNPLAITARTLWVFRAQLSIAHDGHCSLHPTRPQSVSHKAFFTDTPLKSGSFPGNTNIRKYRQLRSDNRTECTKSGPTWVLCEAKATKLVINVRVPQRRRAWSS